MPSTIRLLGATGLLAICWAQPGMAADEALPGQQSVVERGRYLVQAANCISCHTTTGGQPFAGGKPFETTYRFLGQIYSSNITPDLQTGLGAWTEDDFIKAMRRGVARDGKYLFPAFPYTAFTRLSTADIKAIYAYLRTIPAVHSAPPRASFWFRQRWVMALWNALFFSEGPTPLNPAQSEDWNRGFYLVEALGHCGACHTPRNALLAERAGQRLTGGIESGEVEPGKYRTWSAPNLTAAEGALAGWSVDDLKKYLKSGSSRRAGAFGPMNEVIANSLQYLTQSDLAAMASYIKSLPANGQVQQHTQSASEHAVGQALYAQYCDECHLSSGRGGLRKAPPVAGSSIVQARSAASLINVILYSATPAAGIPSSFDAWEDMPGFKDKMSDVQVTNLVNFLRTNWGNRGDLVSPGLVSAQR